MQTSQRRLNVLEEFQRVNVVQTRRINELEAKLRAADAKYSDVQDKLQEFRSKAGLYSKQLRAEGLPVLDGDDAPLVQRHLGEVLKRQVDLERCLQHLEQKLQGHNFMPEKRKTHRGC